VARDGVKARQVRRQLRLDVVLRLVQAARQAIEHRALRSRRRLHQSHSPLQGGLGRFEQLAEHL
jgi:hypothetical protein